MPAVHSYRMRNQNLLRIIFDVNTILRYQNEGKQAPMGVKNRLFHEMTLDDKLDGTI